MAPTPSQHDQQFFRQRKMLLIGVLVVSSGFWAWSRYRRPFALYSQAEGLMQTDPAHSADLLEKAVDLKGGDYPAAQLLWTQALCLSDHLEEATGCFSMIKTSAALDEVELMKLAGIALSKDNLLLAEFTLDRVLEQNPQHEQASLQRMALYFQQGEFRQALELGQALTDQQPQLPAPWLMLGQVYDRLINPSAAAANYQQFLTLENDSAKKVLALRRLAQLSLDLGDFSTAKQCQEELFSIVAPTVDDLVIQAKILRRAGNSEDARTIVDRVLREQPRNISAIELRGLLACDLKDEVAAETDLKRVLQAQPWNKQAHYQLALCLRRQGKTEEAEEHFAENRKLTEYSLRILELQSSSQSIGKQAEIERLEKLAEAYEALGQIEIAARISQQLAALKTSSGD